MEPISCSSGSAPGRICLNRAPLGPLGNLSLLYLPARYSKGMGGFSGLSSLGSVCCLCLRFFMQAVHSPMSMPRAKGKNTWAEPFRQVLCTHPRACPAQGGSTQSSGCPGRDMTRGPPPGRDHGSAANTAPAGKGPASADCNNRCSRLSRRAAQQRMLHLQARGMM